MKVEDKINKIEEKISIIEEEMSLLISVSTSISKALNQILKNDIIKEETNRELFNSLHVLISNLSAFLKDIYELIDKKEENSFYNNDNRKDKITIH
jgi:uncharacterized protein YaaW (UPF0174 family)